MEKTTTIPEGIQFTVEGNTITAKKGESTLVRLFPLRIVSVSIADGIATVASFNETAKSRAMVGTFIAHLNNMIKGLQEPFIYKLKVCSSHFPMTVKQSGNELHVQNFLGEKKMRRVNVLEGVNVKIDGQVITLSSSSIELAGAVASRIEQATRLNKKDRRVFQDGIFITEKAGKAI
jgi:large subunit ribosomal protein L6